MITADAVLASHLHSVTGVHVEKVLNRIPVITNHPDFIIEIAPSRKRLSNSFHMRPNRHNGLPLFFTVIDVVCAWPAFAGRTP